MQIQRNFIDIEKCPILFYTRKQFTIVLHGKNPLKLQ